MENKTQKELIKDLLAYAGSNGVNKEVKQKIFGLVSNEIAESKVDYGKVGELMDKALEKRFGKGEEKEQVKSGSKICNTVTTKNIDTNLPKYFNPYFLYKFLFEYNQNPVLRSTCHDIDSEELKRIIDYCGSDSYDFKKHLDKIIEDFEEHEKEFPAPFQVKALIRGYLTGKDYRGNHLKRGWSSEGIKINWSSDKLADWVTKNPNIPPNSSITFFRENKGVKSFKIEPQIVTSITEKPVQTFTQLVLHFKNLFHLKSGSQGLRAILHRVNSIKKWNEKVEFVITEEEFLTNLEHFTDVDKLIQAYNELLRIIIEQHQGDEKPKVKLRFYEEQRKVCFSIHHLNGRYNKTIQNCLDRREYGRDYNNLICNQINGLCNLYLRADFGSEKFAKINLWDGRNRVAQTQDRFTGVEHILEFPKIKE